MSHKNPKNRNRRSEYEQGWDEGVHDRVRGLSEPGNMNDFPSRFKKGYRDAMNSNQDRPPKPRSKPKETGSYGEDEIDYELLVIQN